MQDAMAVMHKLQTGLDVNVRFTGYFSFSLSIIFAFNRALDKRECLVIIIYRDNFCMKTYDVTPHLNCLNETVQMRGHNIWFR